MTLDWRKHPVACAECSASLMRRLYRPKDNQKIERFFCDRACKGQWQAKNLRPISRERLRHLYLEEGKSAPEIAAIVKRDEKRVWEWLVYDGHSYSSAGAIILISTSSRATSWASDRCFLTPKRITLALCGKQMAGSGLFKDGVHVLKGRKGAAHPRFRGGLTPERQAFYASDEWKEACKSVWHSADAKCQRCGLDHRLIDRAHIKFHVHHIVTFQVRELRALPSNLALLCEHCHRFVHSRRNTTREFLREMA